MFSKEKFQDFLIKARGSRTNKDFSIDSGVSRAYISGYINKKINKPPTPEIIKKLAKVSHNNVSYESLMKAAGYLEDDNTNYNIFLSKNHLNTEKEIEKILNDMKEKLINTSNLMLSGEPATDEAIQSIIDTMRIGMELAKQKNREKYTPYKYRKNE